MATRKTLRNQDVKTYRYKLAEDAPWDQAVLERIPLKKDGWKDSVTRLKALDRYIKSKDNPKGWVVMERFDPMTKKADESSEKKRKLEGIIVDPKNLALMNRDKLVEVAQSWGIKTRMKKEDVLRKMILDVYDQQKTKQEPEKEPEAESKPEEKDEATSS